MNPYPSNQPHQVTVTKPSASFTGGASADVFGLACRVELPYAHAECLSALSFGSCDHDHQGSSPHSHHAHSDSGYISRTHSEEVASPGGTASSHASSPLAMSSTEIEIRSQSSFAPQHRSRPLTLPRPSLDFEQLSPQQRLDLLRESKRAYDEARVTLSSDASVLLNNSAYSDVILRCGNERSFFAHRVILARSPTFARLILRAQSFQGLAPADVRMQLELQCSEYAPLILWLVLRWLYYLRMPEGALDVPMSALLSVIDSAVHYELPQLSVAVQTHIILRGLITTANVVAVWRLANTCDGHLLRDYCGKFFRAHSTDVAAQNAFDSQLLADVADMGAFIQARTHSDSYPSHTAGGRQGYSDYPVNGNASAYSTAPPQQNSHSLHSHGGNNNRSQSHSHSHSQSQSHSQGQSQSQSQGQSHNHHDSRASHSHGNLASTSAAPHSANLGTFPVKQRSATSEEMLAADLFPDFPELQLGHDDDISRLFDTPGDELWSDLMSGFGTSASGFGSAMQPIPGMPPPIPEEDIQLLIKTAAKTAAKPAPVKRQRSPSPVAEAGAAVDDDGASSHHPAQKRARTDDPMVDFRALANMRLPHLQSPAWVEARARLDVLVDIARTMVKADLATLFLYDSHTSELYASVTMPSKIAIAIPCDVGIAGHAFTHRERINCADAQSDPRFFSGVDKKTGSATLSIVAVPLVDATDGGCYGVFEVLNKTRTTPFSQQEEELMAPTCDMMTHVLKMANSEGLEKAPPKPAVVPRRSVMQNPHSTPVFRFRR